MKIDDFLDVEKRYDLYHLQIDKICPWIYYRMNFWNYEICKNLLNLSERDNSRKNIQLYVKQAKSFLLLFKRKNKKYIHSADVLFFSHERRVKTDDFYECIYTDKLAKEYDNSVVLEKPYQGQHLTPVQTKNIYYIDKLLIKAELFYLFHYCFKTSKYRGIYKRVQSSFNQPLEEFRQGYNYQVDYKNVYASLSKIVLQLSVTQKELKKLVEKIQPKIIVETVYYSKYCMVLNELAKEKGIPTIELQHGTMHSTHAAYQFPEGCGEIRQFPDYVYVFSEYWKKCAHLPISSDQIKVTGYPYFERQLNKYKKVKGDKKINIIFVSQGTIGKELSILASGLCELLDKYSYHIIYKLHPGEYVGWRERTPWLVKENIEVVDNLEHNIYEYFAKCSIQVGVYSTAIYEGLGFGLTTYIYNIGHADTLADLCEQGYASYVKNAEELHTSICTYNENKKKDGKAFWMLNSFKNICNEINKLLKQD